MKKGKAIPPNSRGRRAAGMGLQGIPVKLSAFYMWECYLFGGMNCGPLVRSALCILPVGLLPCWLFLSVAGQRGRKRMQRRR